MQEKLFPASVVDTFLADNSKTPDFIRKHNAYYLMPQNYNQTDFYWSGTPEALSNLKDLQTCALAQPWMSFLSLNSTYTKAVPTEAYIGFNSSALLCSWSLSKSNFYTGQMNSPGYDCRNDTVPESIRPIWNNTFYNPKCRGWFQSQRSKSSEAYVSDSYQFANTNKVGMTSCAPISNY